MAKMSFSQTESVFDDSQRRFRPVGASTRGGVLLWPFFARALARHSSAGYRRATAHHRQVGKGEGLPGSLSGRSGPRLSISKAGAGDIRWTGFKRTGAFPFAVKIKTNTKWNGTCGFSRVSIKVEQIALPSP